MQAAARLSWALCLLGNGLPAAFAADPARLHEKYAPKPNDAMPVPELNHRQDRADIRNNADDEDNQAQTLTLDADMLLAQPTLLERAISAAVKTQNVAAIRALLPIYQQYPERDALVEALAQAILARADAQPAQLAQHLRNILQRHPDAAAPRFQLATALHADRQYREADEEFARLQQRPLPESLLAEVGLYRSAIAQQNRWRWYAGLNFINEKNINNAPRQRKMGAMVYNPQTQKREFNGFTFEAPIHDRGLAYQLGGGRRQPWRSGFFGALDMDAQGKYFFRYSRYNDLLIRIAPAVGHASWRNEWQIGPFVERRWFGNRLYAKNIGISARWKHDWTPRIQSFVSAEYGRRTHDQRPFLNNRNVLFSGSVLYQRNPNQYWLGGTDYARESGTRDLDDRFRRRSVRLAWGQAWPHEINTQLALMLGSSRYDGPSFFSNGQRRHDRERSVNLSIWKQNWRWHGLTPRLLLGSQQVRSNDALRESDKKRIILEIKKDW